MEYEVRYYYPKKELNNLIKKLDNIKEFCKLLNEKFSL